MYFSAIPNFCAMALPPGNFLFCFCYVFNFVNALQSPQIHIRQRYVADFWYLGASGCSLLRRLGYQTGIRLMPKSRVKTCFIYMGYGYGLWSSIPCHGNPYIFMYIYNIFRCIYIYFNGLTMPWHISHPTAPQLMASAKAREWSSTKALARRCLTGRMCSTGTAR